MIRSGTGAATTPPSSQRLQARFSRLVTTTKYFAGSTSSCSLISRRQRFASALRLDFGMAHARLKIQQLELCVVEFLAAGAVLVDPLQSQLFFQYPDLQLSPDEFLL